ncbi:Maf family protein [Pseudomonadota bacterium]
MNTESLPEKLILASSSKYRRKLLQRFGIPFGCQSPEIDETVLPGESPAELVARLATRKATVVSKKKPRAIVIGSDQIAVFNGRIIGKPGNYEAALEQLAGFSGQVVEFLTTVSVQSHQIQFSEQHTDSTKVRFRTLQRDEIERYLQKEKPFDCAGAFKAESLGIALFDSIISEDPTALVGLPLIRTAAMLRRAGLKLP